MNKEAEIVDEDFVAREDTYNVTLGGGYPPRKGKIVYQYDLNGKFVKKWENRADAERYCGGKVSSAVSNSIKEKRPAYEFLWSAEYYDVLDVSQYNTHIQRKDVYLYNLDGTFAREFKSLSDCARYLNINYTSIQKAMRRATISKGYYVSSNKVDNFIPQKTKFAGTIHQYDLNGKYIQSFENVSDIPKELNATLVGIHDSILLNTQYRGFCWRQGDTKEDKIETSIVMKRAVGLYTLDGKFVKRYESARDARKEFGNASKILRGKATQTKGYTFKYLDS